jgi:hypothetical protein
MSGLLRRIKRSRAADAGEVPADQQAAAPEAASTTTEGDEAKTTQLPVATPPAIAKDPDRPAGLDELAAAPAVPTGRRSRLRRRLRYLRRARELMLRDLGGLVYEVHRTGGSDFGAHRGVIDGKIERLALVDAESGAIEQALGAPRGETVVFEPGVGGTCDVCGELYGSAARFCARCGTPTDASARETPAAAAEPRHVPPMPKAPGAAAEAPAGAAQPGDAATGETAVLPPADAAAGRGEEPKAAADEPAAAQPAADEDACEAAADEPAAPPPAANEGARDAAADEPAAAQPAADEAAHAARADEPAAPGGEPKTAELKPAANEPQEPGRNPFANISNGRPEDKGKPPELSSGDPLAARESRK